MRRLLVACLAVVPAASCSPFGNGDTFACHADGDCNLGGELGTCANNIEPTGGTCVYSMGPNTRDAPSPPVDAPRETSDASLCIGATLRVCLDPPPTTTGRLVGAFDTGSGTGNGSCDQIQKQSDGPDLCIVAATDWTIAALQVTGGRPLVIVASGTLSTQGISASSGSATGEGADADDACAPITATNDSAGGAGGSFGSAGGDGGDGGGDDGANAGPALTVTAIRGGCAGQSGGTGGIGGHSGGAIYLLSRGTMTITGTLLADGQGGGGGSGARGGGNGAGGGGGGTGGFIGLEAPSYVTSEATIFARAGAGGGGGGGVPQDVGGSGDDGDTNGASGGKGGGTQGGGGGDADNDIGDSGKSGHSQGGGGGGAGGIGVIWVTGPLQGATMSPNPTQK